MLIRIAGQQPNVDFAGVWIRAGRGHHRQCATGPRRRNLVRGRPCGDNEPIVIGTRSNIQEHCVLHTDPGYPLTVGEDCTVGHAAVLHGCTIGEVP